MIRNFSVLFIILVTAVILGHRVDAQQSGVAGSGPEQQRSNRSKSRGQGKKPKTKKALLEAAFTVKNWRRLHLKQQAAGLEFQALNTSLVRFRAVEKKPADDPEVKHLNARVAAKYKQLQKAQRQAALAFTMAGRAIESALALQPKHDSLHLWRSELFATLANSGQSIGYSNDQADQRRFSFGLFNKGLKSAKIAYKNAPHDPHRALTYARLALTFHDYRACESVLEKLVKQDKAGLRERVLLATCYYYQNKFADARQTLTLLPAGAQKRKHVQSLLQVIKHAIVNWKTEQKLRDSKIRKTENPLIRFTIGAQSTVTFQLFSQSAPNTVANFIHLCEQGFYQNSPFHRVLANFMAQSGLPVKKVDKDRDSQGPGYRIKAELSTPRRHHFRGSVAMATQCSDLAAGSQFYVAIVPLPYLDNQATVFGYVLEGMDVVDQLRGNETITKIEILRRGPVQQVEKQGLQ